MRVGEISMPTTAAAVPARARVWAAVWLVVLAAGLVADGVYLARAPLAEGVTDFHQFRHSSRAWLEDAPMYEPVPQGDRVVFNLNPPHFHLVVLPFVGLPLYLGFAVWMAAGIAALVWVLWQLLPQWFATLREPLWPLALLAWLFVTPITGSVLVTGAPVWVMLPILYAAWQAHRQGRLARAGAFIGVLASMKLFLLLLLPWFLLRGEWRAVRAALLGVAISSGIGVAVFGVEAYAGWIEAMRASEGWAWGQLNASVAALTTRAFTETPYWLPLSTDVPARALWVILAVSLLFLTGERIGALSVDSGWALLLTTALLVNPLGWIYYLWWLLPLLLVTGMGQGFSPASARRVAMCGAAFLTIPPWAVFAAQPSRVATLTLGTAYVWGLVCLWISCLLLTTRSSAQASS